MALVLDDDATTVAAALVEDLFKRVPSPDAVAAARRCLLRRHIVQLGVRGHQQQRVGCRPPADGNVRAVADRRRRGRDAPGHEVGKIEAQRPDVTPAMMDRPITLKVRQRTPEQVEKVKGGLP